MTEHCQQHNEQTCTFLNRLECLRGKTGATWAEIGRMIGLSRTRLHQLRRGENEPSQRTLGRLEHAEVAAGLRRPAEYKSGILGLLESVPADGLKIEESEHDAGVVQVKVEFRRGNVPEGFESTVPVKAPSAVVAAQLLGHLLRDEAASDYLRHCLPPKYASEEFLNRLEPSSFMRLLHAAVEMSLGRKWREKVQNLSVGAEQSTEAKRQG